MHTALKTLLIITAAGTSHCVAGEPILKSSVSIQNGVEVTVDSAVSYREGYPVELSVTVLNRGSQPIVWLSAEGISDWDVTLRKGDILLRLPLEMQLALAHRSGVRIRRLDPHKSETWHLDVSLGYSLTPGEYAVSLALPLVCLNGEGPICAKTQPFLVTLASAQAEPAEAERP